LIRRAAGDAGQVIAAHHVVPGERSIDRHREPRLIESAVVERRCGYRRAAS
jgi:hypothetical protein